MESISLKTRESNRLEYQTSRSDLGLLQAKGISVLTGYDR
jgi:hypothetical protein